MVVGGKIDENDRYISPTIMNGCTPDDPVMQVKFFEKRKKKKEKRKKETERERKRKIKERERKRERKERERK